MRGKEPGWSGPLPRGARAEEAGADGSGVLNIVGGQAIVLGEYVCLPFPLPQFIHS